MIRFPTPLIIELRRGPGLYALPILIAAGGISAWQEMATPSVWTYATQGVAASVRLAAPVATGVAAWAGVRGRRCGTLHVERLGARTPAAGPILEAAALICWAVGAYVLLGGAIFLWTATRATWGGPNWSWVAATGLGLALTVALGFFVGRMLPWRFTPLGAAVVHYIAIVWHASHADSAWYFLLPETIQVWLPFDQLDNTIFFGQMLWYSGCLLLLAGISLWLSRSATRQTSIVAIAGLTLATAGVVAVTSERDFYQLNEHMVWTCVGNAPQVCVHPAFTASQDAVAARVRPVADRLENTPFALQRVEQRPRGIGSAPTPGAVAFALDAPRSGDLRDVSVDVAANAFGIVDSCSEQARKRRSGEPWAYARILVAWASGNSTSFAGDNEQLERDRRWFDRLELAQRRAWLASRTAKIRTCTLGPADFR